MLGLPLQGVLESSSHRKSSAAADPLVVPASHPSMAKCEEEHVKESQEQHYLQSCAGSRSTGIGGSASCRMVSPFVLSSFSFLMCTTLVPSCSQSCAWAFRGRLVLQYWILSSWLCFQGQNFSVCSSSLCGRVQHLDLGHCLMDGLSFVTVNMGKYIYIYVYSKYGFVFKGFSYHTSS